MKYIWKDLKKPLNCFTVRGTTMVNLDTGKIVSNYAANTKIVVVQKSITPTGTYYRTSEAKRHGLNYAFRASAFGLPNEIAPSVPSPKSKTLGNKSLKAKPVSGTPLPAKKTKTLPKSSQAVSSSKGGEKKKHQSWIKKLFGRKDG